MFAVLIPLFAAVGLAIFLLQRQVPGGRVIATILGALVLFAILYAPWYGMLAFGWVPGGGNPVAHLAPPLAVTTLLMYFIVKDLTRKKKPR